LGSSPFARHYSGNRGFFPFLRLLRCFSSPACRLLPYVFRQRHTRITTCGFPHSEIPGSKVGQHLPRAYRSHPRPSSALGAKASTVCPSSLDHEEHLICRYGVFKVQAEPPRSATATVLCSRDQPRSFKTQQRTSCSRRGRRNFQANSDPDGRSCCHHSRVAHRGNCPDVPRKEVIQPQLPLRLPCYDFTPVTNPTFGGCLPCGLAHRLRVLPASVV
jgi:hypothetical protein